MAAGIISYTCIAIVAIVVLNFKFNNMTLSFNIEYRTNWGEEVKVQGSVQELGLNDAEKAVSLQTIDGIHWSADIEIACPVEECVHYSYHIYNNGKFEISAAEINEFKGKIEFRNVYFAYKDEDWILKNVSFVINPKETCAFVGATGAGKTTILSLIVRNYEIQKGQILIDDIDIKKIKVTSLRKAIGQMLQDVFLFSGTIRTNITLYDDEKYSDEEIIKVCDYVNASSFINKLDKGLDEYVIERGENFSSGQRQLLSFARTVLAKPQILILDEATANIDTETETLIQESLAKIKNIGTMLIVAHRLSTIQHSDQIIVLNNGEIVEKGTHQELLKHKGLYYKLYELQFNNN